MTREEAIDYLEGLSESPDMCYACDQCGGFRDEDCKLRKVIAWINRPLGERLIDVLREVRGEE